ncbi:PREDICTED: uncharacterized protein LOC107329376 isoform X3 [Acropora digitifera]|uniref:uncharacterized protein LOC107329376 isoform X3 n=1 Tax=Acropora digitifera TaxID=70779 RepID=UPI00077A62F0|nr:PREDICTED: uncharacterized protein LOC107329376 isoform X3 [Acropora digitifera]
MQLSCSKVILGPFSWNCHVELFHQTVRELSAVALASSEMALDAFRRGWNSVRVKFWSIGYKKRLILQFGALLFIVLSGLFLWTSLFANLSDLRISQKHKGNASTPWDKWVKDNDLQSIGDIWDGCEFSLNGGAVHVIAEYLGRELYNVKHKVCKMGAETFSCPIEKGKKMHVNEKVKLPQYIPRGEYYATAKLMNENEECLGMTESNIIL